MSRSYNLYDRLMADYDQSLSYSAISGERLAQRLHELAQIGLTEQDGSYRVGFSPEEKTAKELVKRWMREAGLSVREDGAGNVFGRLEGKNPQKPAILSGSHVDSVPNGGHFDGPLGVLVALEVAEAWQANGYQPEHPYEVVVFTDEEGARFNGGLTGSQALVGDLDIEKQLGLVDSEGQSFEQVLEQAGLSLAGLVQTKRDATEIKAYVEVHIEQGKRLEKEDLSVGIVTGIAGPCWMNMSFKGQAGHAGNTPMNDRQDALVVAAEFIMGVKQLPSQVSSTAVATVGKLDVWPNGVNVIPGEVHLTVDLRDIFAETRDCLAEQVIQLGQTLAGEYGLGFSYEKVLQVDPVPVSVQLQELLAQVIQEQSERLARDGLEQGKDECQDDKLDALFSSLEDQAGEDAGKYQAEWDWSKQLRPYYLPSGAGHDAMILGRHVPMAMLFVRSKAGVSHDPKEWTSLNDCVISVHILKAYLELLMKEELSH